MNPLEPIRALLIDAGCGWAQQVEPKFIAAGLRTYLARECGDLLAEARMGNFDVVLVASPLREVDQTDLPKIIRMVNRAEYLPIIWMASDPNPTATVTALELGIDLVLPRETPLAVLLAHVLVLARTKRRTDDLRYGLEQLRGTLTEQAGRLTRLQTDNDELRELAVRDPLTRLHNPRYMHQWMAQTFAYAARYRQPLSVLVIDLDHFKWINDCYGHLAGDRTLAEVGRVLRSVIRESDLAARYGGDEFLVALPNTPSDVLPEFAQRLLTEVRALHINPANGKHRLSCSLGSATFPADEPAATHQELIMLADQALFAAKRAGRARLVQWHRLEHHHHQALAARRQAALTTPEHT